MLAPVLKRVGIGIVAATLLVVGIGLLLPRDYSVTRSVVIEASRDSVHALCSDLEQWPRWTPWFRADPDLEITLGSVTRGAGAHQSWVSGNAAGELTVTRSDPDWGVGFDLILDAKGRQAASTMLYADTDTGLQVTWELAGDNGMNPLGRVAGLLMDMVVGPMFDEGLARLKLVAEETVAQDDTTTG
ncbi:MAG: SRPBCC family protein [bacterium]|nr:SRPBCC family protein [bacterium]